jgi:hypothetical protein
MPQADWYKSFDVIGLRVEFEILSGADRQQMTSFPVASVRK